MRRELLLAGLLMMTLNSCGGESSGSGAGGGAAGAGRGPAAPADDGVRRNWKDPHGFEVDLPDGWGARVLGSGAVVMSPEPETLSGPQASVWMVSLKKEKPAAEVAKEVLAAYKAFIPDLAAEGPHQLSDKMGDSCSFRGTLTVGGQKWKFMLLASVDKRTATLTGMAAPAAQYETAKPGMIRALATFRPNPALRDAKRIAPPASEWVAWKDPTEGAFTASIPKGWVAEGGIFRPYFDACGHLKLKKDGKDSTALHIVRFAPPIFTEPSPALAMAGFREGSRYNPSGGVAQDSIVMRYLGAKGYIEKIYLPEVVKQYPDAKLAGEIKARPDMAGSQPTNPWITTSYDAAEAEITGTVAGVGVRSQVYVLTTRITMPGTNMGLWHATIGSFCSPPAEFDRTRDVFFLVRDSLAVNVDWALREAREVRKRSQILAAANEEVSRSIRETYESRGRVNDEISRKWSNAILGRVDLVNPETGEVHRGVPSGSGYYWKVGADIIAGTETHTSPALGAVLLQDMDDLRK